MTRGRFEKGRSDRAPKEESNGLICRRSDILQGF